MATTKPTEVTPHRYRKQRKLVLETCEAYRTARAKALAVKRAWITAGRPRGWYSARDASAVAWEARFWALAALRDLANMTPVTGAAWSDRGLANVRAANARRNG